MSPFLIGRVFANLFSSPGALRYSFALLGLALMVILFMPQTAVADDLVPGAVVQCDASNNRMLLRFGEFDGGVPQDGASVQSDDLTVIPDAIEKQWQGISYAAAGECDFKDGQKVSVSTINGPISHASSSEAFEMIIDNRIVYANFVFYPDTNNGFSDNGDFFPISAVQYDGKNLLECDPHYGSVGFVFEGQSGAGQPECHDVSNRLLPGYKYLTADEQDQLKQILLQRGLSTSLSPFCKALPSANAFIPLAGSGINPPFAVPSFVSAVPPVNGHVYETNIDINNDGKTDTVFLVYDFTDYFDGSYIVAFTKTPNNAIKFVEDMLNGNGLDLGNGVERNVDVPSNLALLNSWNAIFISLPFADEGIRYINNTPFEYSGKTYIYSTSDEDPDEIPSAIVSEIQPDNTFKRVCTFP